MDLERLLSFTSYRSLSVVWCECEHVCELWLPCACACIYIKRLCKGFHRASTAQLLIYAFICACVPRISCCWVTVAVTSVTFLPTFNVFSSLVLSSLPVPPLYALFSSHTLSVLVFSPSNLLTFLIAFIPPYILCMNLLFRLNFSMCIWVYNAFACSCYLDSNKESLTSDLHLDFYNWTIYYTIDVLLNHCCTI